jgi:hypothetical protein
MEEDAEDYTRKHPEDFLWILELAYHKTGSIPFSICTYKALEATTSPSEYSS